MNAGTTGHGAPDGQWTQEDPTAPRRDGVGITWNVLYGLELGIIGLLTLATVIFVLSGEAIPETTQADAYLNAAVLAVAFGLIPLLWAVFTRVGGWRGAMTYLGWPRFTLGSLGGGILLLLGTLALIFGFAAIYTLLWGEPDASEVAEGLAEVLDIPLIIAVSLAAGIGEEIFFRGVLQTQLARLFGARVGDGPFSLPVFGAVMVQGMLFGAAHAGYDALLNFVVPLMIGILFGFIHAWKRDLWIVIIAHTLYDVVALSIAAASA